MAVQRREGRLRPVCTVCGYVHYFNPAPAVAVVVIHDGQVLLVRRKYEPRQGLWSLPAGFVEWDEDIREAAVREAKEETGCEVAIGELLGVYSAFEDERTHVVLIVFRGQWRGGNLQAGDDASEVRFFPLALLPEDFAFRVHRQVLEELRERDGS
jgi:8-oxo-dGTP diphosphatase